MRNLGTCVLVGSVLFGGGAEAATYYTSTSGSDANTCTQAQAAGQPKRTIAGGIGCLRAGDTLLVRGGTYDENLTDTPVAGTSWSNPVRIANYPGEVVWMSPTTPANGYIIYFAAAQQYVEFDGINLDGRRRASNSMVNISAWSGGNAHHIRFKNAEVVLGVDGRTDQTTDSGAFGFLVTNDAPGTIGANEFINLKVHGGGDPGDLAYAFYIQSSDNIIDGCDCYDQQGYGIQIYNGNAGGTPNNNIIRNSRIHDSTRSVAGYSSAGILIDGRNTKIYNNVITNIRGASGGYGILVWGGPSTGNEIYNNTIYGNQDYGILLESNTSNSTVMNNISFANGVDFANRASGTVTSNNLFGVDPMFANPSAGDFHLKASSPAQDTGTTIPMVGSDISGMLRPQAVAYDIGAYEGSGTKAPGAPTNVRVAR